MAEILAEALEKSGEVISPMGGGQLAAAFDRQPPQLGLWSMLPVFAQRQGLQMKSQAGVPHLQLNLHIKPRKRLIRDKPEALTVPNCINQVWSMEFMHDQLENGR